MIQSKCISLFAVLFTLVALTGCPSRTVTITSEPSGAIVLAQPVLAADAAPGSAPADAVELGTTPLKKTFNFGRADKYQLTLSLPLYESATVDLSATQREQKAVNIALKQYARIVPLRVSEPTRRNGTLLMHSIERDTLAYIDEFERSANVKKIQRVTANEEQAELLGKPVLSPTSDMLVFEVYFQQKTTSQYTVKRSDTYGEIASDHGMTFTQFVDANPSLSKKRPEDKASTNDTVSIVTADLYSNIWKQTIGSFARSRVTEGKWRDTGPTFTPDGEFLLFSSNRTSTNPTIWRKRIDGRGGNTRVTNSTAGDYHPSIGQSNDVVAYMSLPRGANEPQIWTVNSTGGLTSQLREGSWPRLSPDGERILFLRAEEETGNMQIWVMQVDGTNETQLTQNIDYNIIDPRWSPDGKWIVYASDEGEDEHSETNYDIWLVSANGGEKIRLTTNGSHDDGPMFDRSGSFVYFRSNRGGLWNIWRAQPVLEKRESRR